MRCSNSLVGGGGHQVMPVLWIKFQLGARKPSGHAFYSSGHRTKHDSY